MFLDFLNQTKDKTLENSKAISKNVSSFLDELKEYFNQPKFNHQLSKDSYEINRFEGNYGVLQNQRTSENFFVLKNELPKEAFSQEYLPFVKVENFKYVMDYKAMAENRDHILNKVIEQKSPIK